MKKIITAIVLATVAITAHAEKVKLSRSEMSDYKLAMASYEKGDLAEKYKDYLTACIYYRTASIHLISVGPKMEENIKNLKVIETNACKKAGV
jgi:hypothetical protein